MPSPAPEDASRGCSSSEEPTGLAGARAGSPIVKSAIPNLNGGAYKPKQVIHKPVDKPVEKIF